MSKHWMTSCAAAFGVAAFLSIGGAQVGMTPVAPGAAPNWQLADCAVGFHIGPAGACIIRNAGS